jgi:RNA polymerase sigma-70 factor, ECF subfamily
MSKLDPTYPTGPGRSGAGSDARRFEEVVLCHLNLLYRVAFRLTGNTDEAEDLVQETCLRAHRAFGGFELREYGAKPWLLKIMHNLFLSGREQARRGPSLMEDSDLDDFAAAAGREPMAGLAEGKVDWEEFDEELKTAVNSLPPEYRSAIVLWALGDLSYKEIAEVLDCAMGTVMSRLHRARQTLMKSLADYASRRRIRAKPDEIEPNAAEPDKAKPDDDKEQ